MASDESRLGTQSAEAAPTVFVVDDDLATRELVTSVVGTAGFPVESYETGRAFLDRLNGGRPGCLILDVRMPGTSGLAVQEELNARGIRMPIIMMSGYADVPTAVSAVTAGAIDFIEKPFAGQRLLDRVRAAIEIDRKAHAQAAERREISARLARLSPRENEVLQRVVAGRTNKQIATDLGLREKTVEAHRAHVMRKLKVARLADLVRLVSSLTPSA